MSATPFTIRNVIAPLWARWERSPYLRVCRRIERERGLSLDERMSRQMALLRDIVRHAWEECPFYRRLYAEAGFQPGDLKGWEDLGRLPILTKRAIAEHRDDLIARAASRDSRWSRKTSGSTGVSLRFYVDEPSNEWNRGVTLCRDQWTGWRLGEPRAMIWGNPEYKKSWRGRIRNALLDRLFFLDTLRMDRAMMEAFAREILRKRPTLIFGHAHSLYLFARFWREHGFPEHRGKAAVLSTAMVLHPHERAAIAETFGDRIFDRYGCEEVSLIASECEAHAGLHINTDSLVVEVVDGDGTEVRPGEEGRVIVTDLRNRAMPFIRYEVGDVAVPASSSCPCGRTYPLLERVAGRVADYLRTPAGEYVSGISLTENFATLIPGLHQVQIVQEEIDLLRLRVVPRDSSLDPETSQQIARLVSDRFGGTMRYTTEVVDEIRPEPSGKYRFAISKLPPSPGERVDASPAVSGDAQGTPGS